MLIDDVRIKIVAGRGGDGAVAFNKNLMSLGPAGGGGGKGGGVYFLGVSDLSRLNQFRFKKELRAESGKNGKGQFCDGSDGQDLILEVPVGTVSHNLTTGIDTEIIKIGEKILAAKGGYGGRGNFHFRSATNTTPKQYEKGKTGEEFELRLELKLIADVGFVGLPNAGKSSLLNELTNAQVKVANYPFTTLEPNLGAYYDLILADIPGLIEGSSIGRGLGVRFLRHIERTNFIFHLVSGESTSPIKDYKIIRKELKNYSKVLAGKKEYLFLAKSDLLDKKSLKSLLAKLKKLNSTCLPISVYDWDSLEKVKKLLNKIMEKKHLSSKIKKPSN